MEAKSLTKIIFFDTDCISAFLWVNNESILEKLYYGRIIIPRMVYNEISNLSWMKNKVDILIRSGCAKIEDIDLMSDEYNLYLELTSLGSRKLIGKGEAACLALARKHKAIIASNNLRDVSEYIVEFSLDHITTGDILIEAYEKGLINENDGNIIWAEMIAKRRKLGASSFSEYMKGKDPFYSKGNIVYLEKKYKEYKDRKSKLIDEDVDE